MMQYYRTLISAAECLRSQVPDRVIIDCRFDLADPAAGAAAYREGHIPTAHYAHLNNDLSAPPDELSGRHPLPDWRRFADCLARWGIHPESQVVVYDQGSGAFAARLWWLLRAVGHDRVALLDGGWPAWLAAGGQPGDRPPAESPGAVDLRPGSGWVTTDEVEANLRAQKFVLVDARGAERYAGVYEPIDAVAGHIPGALNRPFESNLGGDGLFRPADALRRDWLDLLGAVPARDVVHMCGSGVTACHNLLSMELAGLAASRLYVGSWSEWQSRNYRPVATGRD